MSIFQKGGTPGLAPLRASAPEPAERLVEASPLAAVPPTAPAPAAAPAPILRPTPPPVSEAPTPIETYSGDFRARVKETRASTATVLAAEQDAAAQSMQPAEVPEKNARNIGYIVGGVSLLVVGGIGVYFAYSHYLTVTAPVIIAPVTATPIFVDSREQVSGTGATLMQAVRQSAASPLPVNTVRLLSYDKAGTSIFAALETRVPGMLLRNTDAAKSMAGVVSTANGQSPFFILSVGSYSATFSGMLSWEPAMVSDLSALYPLYPAPATATTSATSTGSAAAPFAQSQNSGFRDEVVSNHDVRVYRDASGNSILLYGYWDQATLIIARDPAAFAEILGRLATSHS